MTAAQPGLNDRQIRALKAENFHFDSSRFDAGLAVDAEVMERLGLITIKAISPVDAQETVYACTVTAKGRRLGRTL